MHGLLEHMVVDYANLLRSKYPNKTNARKGIPEEIPDFLVRIIKGSKSVH
jgi:hypothetical protein